MGGRGELLPLVENGGHFVQDCSISWTVRHCETLSRDSTTVCLCRDPSVRCIFVECESNYTTSDFGISIVSKSAP